MELKIKLPTTYSDKTDLISKSLDLYKTLTGVHMTQRDKDVLILCFIYDIDSKDFGKKLMQAKLGIDSKENVNTIKSRLRSKGFIVQDKYNQKISHLSEGLKNLKKAVMDNDTVTFAITFQKSE